MILNFHGKKCLLKKIILINIQNIVHYGMIQLNFKEKFVFMNYLHYQL